MFYGFKVLALEINLTQACPDFRSAGFQPALLTCICRGSAPRPWELRSCLMPRYVKPGKLLLKIFHLGQIKRRDVWIVRMLGGIVLVIIFRAIESLERNNLRHDVL